MSTAARDSEAGWVPVDLIPGDLSDPDPFLRPSPV
jgi:hypothetical protein